MSLFHKKDKPAPVYPPERFEPVLRCSICTGEQVACMRDKETGRLQELMLIRTRDDLECFCRSCGISADSIKKVY